VPLLLLAFPQSPPGDLPVLRTITKYLLIVNVVLLAFIAL
jgi:hypothetical protein